MKEDEISGCHISIWDPNFKSFSETKYIILGHQGCNNKHKQAFKLHFEVDVVEAICKDK